MKKVFLHLEERIRPKDDIHHTSLVLFKNQFSLNMNKKKQKVYGKQRCYVGWNKFK